MIRQVHELSAAFFNGDFLACCGDDCFLFHAIHCGDDLSAAIVVCRNGNVTCLSKVKSLTSDFPFAVFKCRCVCFSVIIEIKNA